MDVNDDFRLEEELFGSEGRRESRGEWSSNTLQEIVAKQTGKRPREPTMKIKEKKNTGPKEKAGEGPARWVRPLYLHDENDHLMRCSPPSLATVVAKKGDYVTCLICHRKVSFNKYRWTTPRQHMRKYSIHSPSNLKIVVQLAKQCWKEWQDFLEERLLIT